MEKRKILAILVMALGLMVCQAEVSEAGPMGTAFTYQGHLYDANHVADGLYDFQFELYNDPCTGTQQGSTIYLDEVDVIDGYFTVELDFGNVFNGNARWLKIGIRPGDQNDPNVYALLEPRQEVTPTPYALQTRGIFVDESGNVGIGTTSPNYKLEVAGNVRVSSTASIGGNATIGGKATIGPGHTNTGSYAFVAGYSNTASGYASTVGGGKENTASGSSATVGGGAGNTASGSAATVGGGNDNTASGFYSTVPGGLDNTAAGDCSFAAGRYARANHQGTFVWASPPYGDFASTANYQFLIRASGGVGIGTASPAAGYMLDVQGKIQATAFDVGDITFRNQETQEILWRMFEDEDGLYLENVKTGKLYTFVLQEMGKKDVNRPISLEQAIKEIKAENKLLKQRLEVLERANQRHQFTKSKGVQQ